MNFEGEHLLIGNWGHVLVLLAFTASLLSAAGFFITTLQKDEQQKIQWLKYARVNFIIQTVAILSVFVCIFYICSHHYLEYFFAYKHTSKELAFKYLLACIWEDQSGSFLLWSIWHSVIGLFLMRKSKEWEAPVMFVISLAQVFLAMMIMGVYIFGTKIGNSPFVLTRNEINGPIFSRPDYLNLIKDGVGLNVLLRNYWMVIHPPVLFLGFALSIVPFAYAYAGLVTKKLGDWIKPVIPYTLFSTCVLGIGIMMGGKWAYESLSFGGYWAWDPVENASLVPWLILIAGLHTMVIYKATGQSLKASYLFSILGFVFILYSTYLTRTGILGDTSVHAFTEAGNAMNLLILIFLLFFTIGSLLLLLINIRKIPGVQKEEAANSREFWMFIGSLIFFLSALFIISKTSIPVVNAVFGTKLAPPQDVEFSYNKVMVLVAVIIGILTAIGQYFKYTTTPSGYTLKKLVLPTLIAAIITGILAIVYPINYLKGGAGFLGALYFALFATIYAFIANSMYIFTTLKGNFKSAGGSIAHLGFALMIIGMLISEGNKTIISEEKFKDFSIPMGIDPRTKNQDDPAENINLIREIPNNLGPYVVTYQRDSIGSETGRKFYHLLFERKDTASKKITESFYLNPDVYLMKNNNMSSNPDTKNYLTHDVFTYISYAMNPAANVDTNQFKTTEIAEGDTIFYSKGYIQLNKVIKNPASNKFNIPVTGPAVIADLIITGKDSMKYHAEPMILIDSFGLSQVDDTVFAQNLYVRFAGVSDDQKKLKIAVKESDKAIDFVTLKAYVFPYIILVWLGLIIMAVGFMISIVQKLKYSPLISWLVVTILTTGLFYMFLIAHN